MANANDRKQGRGSAEKKGVIVAGPDARARSRKRTAGTDNPAPARDTRDSPAENPATGPESRRAPKDAKLITD